MAEPELRVAIVHDWLVGGGAELVVEQLHKLYPEAPIYTSYSTKAWRERLDGKVVTGWLQHLGSVRKFIPVLRIWWFTHLKFEGYDLVISSSGAEAKGVKVPDNTLHVNYCHAPAHYYWSRYAEYLKRPGFGSFDPIARLGLRFFVTPLRIWDYKAAQRPDYIIANSTHIQADIKKYYGRDSVVIHPPVDTKRFAESEKVQTGRSRHGYVIAGRQTPYKRIDLAISACTQLGLPLLVIGNGPDHQRLVGLAGPTIRFRTQVADTEMAGYFQSAAGFIFPGLDDFGITPVEALAAGTPVIAFQAGGALDYIVPGKTGAFFSEQTTESLVEALESFRPETFKPKQLRAKAAEFSPELFRRHWQQFIDLTHLHFTRNVISTTGSESGAGSVERSRAD